MESSHFAPELDLPCASYCESACLDKLLSSCLSFCFWMLDACCESKEMPPKLQKPKLCYHAKLAGKLPFRHGKLRSLSPSNGPKLVKVKLSRKLLLLSKSGERSPAKGVRQKESGKRSLAKKVTKKVIEVSEKVTKRGPKEKNNDLSPFADLLLWHRDRFLQVYGRFGCNFPPAISGRGSKCHWQAEVDTEGFKLPVGSVRVSSSAGTKWLMPIQFTSDLRICAAVDCVEARKGIRKGSKPLFAPL